MRPQVKRGGAVTLLLAVIATGSVAALGVYSASSPGTTVNNTTTKSAKRKTPPVEIATVLTMVGITPESLAAAGITVGECEAVFDAANVYCLQTDRLNELRIAYGNLNQAKQRTSGGGGGEGQLTIAQAQTAVDDLISDGFNFATASLVAGQVEKLSRIKASTYWSVIPAPYRTVERTKAEWLSLRAAFWSKQTADRNGRQLSEVLAQRISDAASDTTVATALSDTSDRLDSIKQAWNNRFH